MCCSLHGYSSGGYSRSGAASHRARRLSDPIRTRSCDRSRMIKRIKFVGVPVKDQDRALEFWTKRIGLQIATDQPMGDGQRWIELKIPGAQTGLVLFTPPG